MNKSMKKNYKTKMNKWIKKKKKKKKYDIKKWK